MSFPMLINRHPSGANLPPSKGTLWASIPTQLLQRVLKLMLAEKSFQFNGENYLEIHGTALGTKMTAAFANIFRDLNSRCFRTARVETIP